MLIVPPYWGVSLSGPPWAAPASKREGREAATRTFRRVVHKLIVFPMPSSLPTMLLLELVDSNTTWEQKVMTALQEFRGKMDSGAQCLGPSITLKDPVIAEALGPDSDFLWIDTEHSPMTIETVAAHLLGARACNKPALVRVPGSLTESIKPILDSGVDGIIVPQVTGVDEVKKVVADCRYPPTGNRGFGPRRGMD